MFVGRPFPTQQKVKGTSELTAELTACADIDSNAGKNEALTPIGLSDGRGSAFRPQTGCRTLV